MNLFLIRKFKISLKAKINNYYKIYFMKLKEVGAKKNINNEKFYADI
jgi:hypothetical protein